MSLEVELIFELSGAFFALERFLFGPFDNGRFVFVISKFFDDKIRIQEGLVSIENGSVLKKKCIGLVFV